MALIETSYGKIIENNNSLLEPQEREDLDFTPIVHVKDVYKSFDYKNNKKNKGIATGYSREGIPHQQQLRVHNTTRSLTVDYSTHEVLNGIDLKIRKGEFITIVGPSGCGKSTLLNIIAGLDNPDSGSVLIRGVETVANGDTLLTKRIMIFQEGALFPWLNVQDNVEFGLKIAKVPKKKSREVADKYIELVGLSKFSESFVYQLSGGMKQSCNC